MLFSSNYFHFLKIFFSKNAEKCRFRLEFEFFAWVSEFLSFFALSFFSGAHKKMPALHIIRKGNVFHGLLLSIIAIMESEKTCKWRLKDCAECTFVLDISLHRFASNCNISFANFYAVCSYNTIDHFMEPWLHLTKNWWSCADKESI